jgi:hypothetical protein
MLKLKIGVVQKDVIITPEASKKAVLSIRDAFRKAGIKADVIIQSEEKILD